jgi:transcriptional regulator with XRE-family HTH domain
MPTSALAGTRLRQLRLAMGLRQADLAVRAGISASYLNLIEHNRRRIGPDVLTKLAAALGLPEAAFSEAAEGSLMDDLRAAAADTGEVPAELDRIEDFAGRFPGWAGVLADLHHRSARLARAVEALNDRMSHDPHLQASLHDMLSAVSSVRSTAGILVETADIPPEWRARFHRNLHQDSERLASGAEALVAYLDGSGQAVETGLAAPQEELEAWLASRGWHLPEVEAGDAGALAGEVARLASGAARVLAQAWVARSMADARALPLQAFLAARADLDDDPAALAATFGCDMLTVFRRIAMVPGAPEGLVVCDASGTLVFRKPVAGFALPRFGAACPLWPLFTALSRPMVPVSARVAASGPGARQFVVRAFCQPHYPGGFGGPELREAAMLIAPHETTAPGATASGAGAAVPVGSTCRVCPRAACPGRREPSIMGEEVG